MKTTNRSKKGFTLIEIMIVVFIIGVIAAIAIPSFSKYLRHSRAATFASDIRTLANASNQYAMESGYWIEDTAAGAFPTELDGYFSQQKYALGSPLGGDWRFVWDDDLGPLVGVEGATVGDEIFAMIDNRIDDGNLSNGTFRKIGANYYYLLD